MRRMVACIGAGIVMASAAASMAQPCTTATGACTEMVGVPGTEGRTLVYRSFPLDARNPSITRALIVIHGLLRDGDDHYRSALAAAFLAGALQDTLVIAPRFASNEGGECDDALAPGEVSWHCHGRNDSWHLGGAATAGATTSFDVLDEVLRTLDRKDLFPNLRAIVVAGHSGGGQFVVRYAMTSVVHDKLAVKPAYVVMNPSSYTYLDETRPGDATRCVGYDAWPYGMRSRNGYAARVSDEQMRRNLVDRPATLLLGEMDTLPVYGFDRSCPAMAQGPTRLARGQAYAKYVREKYGAKHAAVVVDACAHSSRCMLTANAVLPLLFPK